MSSDARQEVFSRLRHACGDRSANDILRDSWSLGHAPAPTLPSNDVHAAFLANVLKNRGTVDVVRTRTGAVKAIAQYLYQQFRTQRLVAGNDARLAALPWRDAGLLPRFGNAESGEAAALSYAHLGVAELGAIVTWTGRANPSANNLLPEHHIVLVDAADVVATSEDAWARMNASMEEEERPRGINFIAGPSSSADIEGKLVYGAHGPRGWHVILLGDISDEALAHADTGSPAA